MLSAALLLISASCVPAAAKRYSDSKLEGAAFDNSFLNGPEGKPIPAPAVIAAAIAPGKPAAPFSPGDQSEADRQSSLTCLATAIYYEARSEPEDGQRAVAQVVLNRVRHPAFPNSVCGVVYQGSQRRTGCQFSFTCDGSMGHRREPIAWARAGRLAKEALDGYVYAPVGHATHFHTTAIHPWWAASMARAITVGSHIFYRWHGEWGDPRAFRRPYSGHEGFAGNSETPRPMNTEATVYGVKIHRGSTAPALASAVAAPSGGVRSSVSGGVTIHRGMSTPKVEAEAAVAATQEAGGTATAS
jgi:spore germination cell wall hydrolase CwlJ-like protein